jgi:hypothetical protein
MPDAHRASQTFIITVSIIVILRERQPGRALELEETQRPGDG